MDNKNIIEKKIYYHDTDAGEVVYYANYLKYLEEGRTQYLIDKGLDLKGLGDKGIWFVVAKLEIDYKLPAQYQDTLQIVTEIEKIKSASMVFMQNIYRGDALIARSTVVLVCVNDGFKPMVIPDDIRAALTAENTK
jgi:acyl-CoA thioester hydrolase